MQPTSYTKFRKVCSLLRVTCKFEKAKFGPRTGKADWGEGGVRVQNPQNPEKSCSRDDDRKWRPDRRDQRWLWWRWLVVVVVVAVAGRVAKGGLFH